MKEVIAIIRPERWPATREALEALDLDGLTHHRVVGRGRQRGLRYLRRASDAGEGDMPYLPKRLLRCLVEDSCLTAAINAIVKANQTGNIGDGKIFVRTVTAAEDPTPSDTASLPASPALVS